jgi:hypothetical protein
VLHVGTVRALWIIRKLFGQKLERYRPAELQIFGLVDHSHRTLPQLFQHAVVGNGLAYEVTGGGRELGRLKELPQTRPAPPALQEK